MNKTSAMILAGGKGKRMGPLCNSRPKPALPFAGGYRVIDFSLSNCINSQITDIGIMTGYQRSYLAKYLKEWQSINARRNLFSILEPKRGSYSGTADAVYQNLAFLSRMNAGTVLVLAADHIYQMDYRKMIAFHNEMKADVTVGAVTVPIETAVNFGIVKTGPENRVIDFVEKPARPQSNLVSMGIYVFNREVLEKYLKEDAADRDSSHDFGHSVLPKMVSRSRVFAYRFGSYWQDIGTPQAYHQSNLDFLRKQPPFNIDDTWPIYSNSLRADTRNHGTGSFTGPGCVIKGQVYNSILSPGVWVGEGALIKDSVIMANTSIGRYSTISNCILDEGSVVGESCRIGPESGNDMGQPEVIVVGRDTRIPSYAEIRQDSDLLAVKHRENSLIFTLSDVFSSESQVEPLTV